MHFEQAKLRGGPPRKSGRGLIRQGLSQDFHRINAAVRTLLQYACEIRAPPRHSRSVKRRHPRAEVDLQFFLGLFLGGPVENDIIRPADLAYDSRTRTRILWRDRPQISPGIELHLHTLDRSSSVQPSYSKPADTRSRPIPAVLSIACAAVTRARKAAK